MKNDEFRESLDVIIDKLRAEFVLTIPKRLARVVNDDQEAIDLVTGLVAVEGEVRESCLSMISKAWATRTFGETFPLTGSWWEYTNAVVFVDVMVEELGMDFCDKSGRSLREYHKEINRVAGRLEYPSFKEDLVYFVTHLVFVRSSWGMKSLNRDEHPKEFELLRACVNAVKKNPELYGEVVLCLRIFGEEVAEAKRLLLVREQKRGVWVTTSLYTRFHSIFCGIIGCISSFEFAFLSSSSSSST